MASKSDDDSGNKEKSPEKKDNASFDNKITTTTNPVFLLNSSDNPGTPIVAAVLNGENCRTWFRSMKTALRAKVKLGSIDGSIKKPKSDSPDYQHWEKADSMVMAWIINSVDPSLHASISHATTARDTWEDLEERFGQTNAPRVHQLWRTMCLIQQESGVSIKDLSTQFKSYLDELSELQPLPECTYGAAKALLQREEENRVHLFLGSLDNEQFAYVKATILNSDPLPSLRSTFNHVIREESRFVVEKERNTKIDSASTFYSNNTNRQRGRDGAKLKCNHCGKIGHIKAKCFEIVGYHPNWDTCRSQRNSSKGIGQNAAHFACANEEQKGEPEINAAGHALHGIYMRNVHESMAGNVG